MRPLLPGVLFLCACAPPPPQPPRVWDVSARTLVASYADHSDRWTGQTVRVYLPAGSFECAPGAVHWHAGKTSEPPALVIQCSPPPDNKRPVEVTGVCRGRVEDGHRRASGATWHVRVENGAVSVR